MSSSGHCATQRPKPPAGQAQRRSVQDHTSRRVDGQFHGALSSSVASPVGIDAGSSAESERRSDLRRARLAAKNSRSSEPQGAPDANENVTDAVRNVQDALGGFLGPVHIQGESSLYVNLRCMQLGENAAHLYVGAGITADSQPQAEWRETELKAETMLAVLEPASAPQAPA